MRLTLNKINAEIAKRGGKEKLVFSGSKAEPYFYFINLGPHGVPGEGILVNRLNVYTLEQWLDELEYERKKETNR